MPDSPKTSKTEYLLAGLLLLVLLAYLGLFGFLNFRGFARLALADMYEDTLCARLMWEAKSIFPKRFLFGNQFYVIATPVLAALFYGLCGSMNTAMALATTVMSLLILLSMDWMLRPVLKKPWQRLAALLAFVGLLFGPGSARREDGTQLFFVMCSYYACYVICDFVVLGDYARARLSGGRRLPALLIRCTQRHRAGRMPLLSRRGKRHCPGRLSRHFREGFHALHHVQPVSALRQNDHQCGHQRSGLRRTVFH